MNVYSGMDDPSTARDQAPAPAPGQDAVPRPAAAHQGRTDATPPAPDWAGAAPIDASGAMTVTPAATVEPRRSRRLLRRDRSGGERRGGGARRWIIGAVIGLVLLGGSTVASNFSSTGGTSLGGSSDTYGYYHDKEFAAGSYSSRWSNGGTSLLGNSRSSDYAGPYRYGNYGAAGMHERATNPGVARTDPLYDTPAGAFSTGPDVFDLAAESAQVDTTGGAPVGDSELWSYDASYSPYAGYSNPYLNRLRMAYGPGYGRGAVSEGVSAAVGAGRLPGASADPLANQ